ncbi:MAG: NAD-dependent epimerase/dehydratase family protein [Acidobacteriota bacterium]|nr:NAD-dependent epimerase/dehydratase family protein [Acidobacteriota bacterium]
MAKPEVLITGANGEIGQRLVEYLEEEGRYDIVALDLTEPAPELAEKTKAFYRGNILDKHLMDGIETHHRFEIIFHLAGVLSSTGEKNPMLAHHVNVDGSLNILQIAQNHSQASGKSVVFVFSSSIAAYGIRKEDDTTVPVSVRQYLTPMTMYGINKLYIEQLGRYYCTSYKGEEGEDSVKLDFRCLRFPGLISPQTVPSGGTSDYGPEMLHAAAQGKPYSCFVSPGTMLPFMVMSDAIRSLIMLSRAPEDQLRHRIYNVTAFSVTARQIMKKIEQYWPEAEIDFEPVLKRQAIVDSWPDRIDDGPARRDWDWHPEYDFDSAFDNVLVPHVRKRYENK